MKGPMALTADLVARCERNEPDPGPEGGYRHYVDQDYERAADQVLAAAPPGPLWVFAYGSLIWKPAIPTTDHARATAHGWHRAFCLQLTRYRGSPAQPGLMMGLKRGGSCKGMIHRIADGERRALLIALLRREIGCDEDLTGVRWINVATEAGAERALVFWAEPEGLQDWVDKPMPEVAQILARACGHVGSCAAYLFHTVAKLDELGIRDRNLWRLQHMVADEIRRLHAIMPPIEETGSAAAPEPFAR
ncbi:MAG TPA: gamma-glutamylcyclotransferase [Dongiaceae bacterium]|nr:gamma-glutamylcyclotransferase [Dongiaceae bacterium]